jgi:hypothetical protein
MRTGHRPAWRRRPQSRAARIAVPLAIPMALGLTLGAVLAFTGGPSSTAISQTAAGASASASPGATPSPSVSAASAAPTATATATAPAAAAANVSCDIIVPANALTARGLATPFQLTGPNGQTPAASGCTMANFANLGAFVQATILNPATGALSVYEPLVITQGTWPAAAPVVPTLPAGAVVTLDFGFNGTNLTQVGATRNALRQANCVNGLGGSIFGQVSFCNGTQFFQAAAQAEAQGKLTIPAAGTATKIAGMTCPTTRSFTLIDQDQSDNVTTTYLLTGNGQTAQFNAANKAALVGAVPANNGSDNILLDGFLDPTIGCTPFEAPDLSQDGTMGTSQALDELAAAKDQAAPIALVPENDEMVLVNNAFSATKTNLYRSNVGQPPIGNANNAADNPQNYCQDMVNVQTPFLANNQTLLAGGATPVPGTGNNLLTFMANRLSMSFTNLNCQNFGLKDPVTVTLDGNGAAIAAQFNTTQQTATPAAATAMPTASPTTAAGATPAPTAPGTRGGGHRIGRPHHLTQNPSGT